MRLIDSHRLYKQYNTSMCELVKSTNHNNVDLEALSLLCGAKLIMDAPTVEAIPIDVLCDMLAEANVCVPCDIDCDDCDAFDGSGKTNRCWKVVLTKWMNDEKR